MRSIVVWQFGSRQHETRMKAATGAALPIARVSESMVDVQVVALMKKVRSQAGAEHPAGTGQPIEQGSVTAWDEQLAKFENTSVGAKNRRYRPGGSSGIGTDNSNSGDQVSYQMFKPGVETSPDHLLTGCPGSNRKRADAHPRYDPQRDTRSSHGANMRPKTGLLQRRQEQRVLVRRGSRIRVNLDNKWSSVIRSPKMGQARWRKGSTQERCIALHPGSSPGRASKLH
jgi:hypothetical protein